MKSNIAFILSIKDKSDKDNPAEFIPLNTFETLNETKKAAEVYFASTQKDIKIESGTVAATTVISWVWIYDREIQDWVVTS